MTDYFSEASSDTEDWRPVSWGELVFYYLACFAILWFAHTGNHWIPVLDNANLVFHEAGHPIAGLFSRRLGVYGGTLGQMVFPLVVLVLFYRERKPISFAIGGLWLGENFFNIARYMADARAQELPIIGGRTDLHDWTEIFSRWNLLDQDVFIGHCVRALGWLLILSLMAWLFYRKRQESF